MSIFQNSLQSNGNVNFGKRAINSLDATLENRTLLYKYYDKSLQSLENRPKHSYETPSDINIENGTGNFKFKYINTPHPIGNLYAEQCLAFDLIAQLQKPNLLSQDIKKILSEAMVAYKSLDDKSAPYIKAINTFLNTTSFRAQVSKQQGGRAKEISQKLASLIIAQGIPTKIISRDRQWLVSEAQTKFFEASSSSIAINTWANNDGDGDPQNDMQASFPADIRDEMTNATLLQIFDLCNKSKLRNEMTTIETRISCKDNKKGVQGIKKLIKSIPGVQDIKNISHLLDSQEYKNSYKLFAKWLDDSKYVGNEQNGTVLRDKLDFVLRFTASSFVPSGGSVLSDFEPNATYIMPAIRFMQKAVTEYLQDNQRKPFASTKNILPVCEEKDTIEVAEPRFKEFLEEVKSQYETILKIENKNEKNKKLQELRDILVPNEKHFFWGVFTGPSDLTKDMGGRSSYAMQEQIDSFINAWDKFKGQIPQLKLDQVGIEVEFGKGSSNKRGGNMIPNGISGMTLQGTNLSTWSRNRALAVASYGLAQRCSTKTFYTAPEVFHQAAIDAHCYLLDDKDGIVVKEYNKINAENRFKAIDPLYSNNRGTRCKTGISASGYNPPEYANSRAIGCGSITSYIGLLTSPSFPSNEELIKSQYDLDMALKSPIELDILIKDLYQYVAFSPERAKNLGFSEYAITENMKYINTVMSALYEKCDKEFKTPKDGNYAQAVNDLVDTLTDKVPATALYLFQEQIPIIRSLEGQLSAAVKEAIVKDDVDKSGFSEEECAELGTINNALVNFQLPLIAYGLDVELGKVVTPQATHSISARG